MIPSFDTPRRLPAEVDLTLLWSALFLLLFGHGHGVFGLGGHC